MEITVKYLKVYPLLAVRKVKQFLPLLRHPLLYPFAIHYKSFQGNWKGLKGLLPPGEKREHPGIFTLEDPFSPLKLTFYTGQFKISGNKTSKEEQHIPFCTVSLLTSELYLDNRCIGHMLLRKVRDYHSKKWFFGISVVQFICQVIFIYTTIIRRNKF